jgi:hypothetical protein
MKKKLVIFIIVIIALKVSAQESPVTDSKKNEFGIHAGAVTGLGLSYRHWFDKAGIQITALPVKTDYETFISAGLTGLYAFHNSKYMMVFGYLGNHLFIGEESKDVYNPYNRINETVYEDRLYYNIGFGPGFAFGKTVRFNLMVGYGFYDIFEKFNMYPTGEIGLYFRF